MQPERAQKDKSEGGVKSLLKIKINEYSTSLAKDRLSKNFQFRS
jgi:hypothetical protein